MAELADFLPALNTKSVLYMLEQLSAHFYCLSLIPTLERREDNKYRIALLSTLELQDYVKETRNKVILISHSHAILDITFLLKQIPEDSATRNLITNLITPKYSELITKKYAYLISQEHCPGTPNLQRVSIAGLAS